MTLSSSVMFCHEGFVCLFVCLFFPVVLCISSGKKLFFLPELEKHLDTREVYHEAVLSQCSCHSSVCLLHKTKTKTNKQHHHQLQIKTNNQSPKQNKQTKICFRRQMWRNPQKAIKTTNLFFKGRHFERPWFLHQNPFFCTCPVASNVFKLDCYENQHTISH